jgi:glucosamine--fructose-6-phosphate aminotransferase (isomerizing)
LEKIYEQLPAITSMVSGRINLETGEVNLQRLNLTTEDIENIDRIVLVACGTSLHSALPHGGSSNSLLLCASDLG